MTWVKLESHTPDKPEVHRMAAILGIDPDAVLGKLARVWIWADQQTYDGNAGSVTASLLDRITTTSGFAAAMQTAGWLVESDHGLTFPNFERQNGNSAKTRAQTAKRVTRHRESVNASVTVAALPEKRREEKKKESKARCKPAVFDPSGVSIPNALDGDRFREAWGDWIRHRQEKKKPLTPTSTAKQLRELAVMGLDRAVAAIDHTIVKGWEGIREPEPSRTVRTPESHPVYRDLTQLGNGKAIA